MWSPVSSECKGVFCHWELTLFHHVLHRTRQYWGWERWICVNLCTPLTSSCALRFYEGGTQRHELRADMEGMNVSASIPYHSCVTCQYFWIVLSVELLYLHHRWIVMTYRRTELISRIPFFSPIVYTLRKGTSTIGLDNTNKPSGLWVYLRFKAYSWRESFPMKMSLMMISFEGVVRREWCEWKFLLRSFYTGKWLFHSIGASWWRVDVLWRLESLTSLW